MSDELSSRNTVDSKPSPNKGAGARESEGSVQLDQGTNNTVEHQLQLIGQLIRAKRNGSLTQADFAAAAAAISPGPRSLTGRFGFHLTTSPTTKPTTSPTQAKYVKPKPDVDSKQTEIKADAPVVDRAHTERLNLLGAAAAAVKLALQQLDSLQGGYPLRKQTPVVPTAEEVLVSIGHVFPGQIDAAKARRKMWDALQQVLAALKHQGVPIFLRAGTWLAAMRNHGWPPFDYDNDFAILDIHEDKLRRAKLPKPFTLKVTGGKPGKFGKFKLSPSVAGWPLMDGVMYITNATNDTVVDISRPERFTFAFSDVLNLVDVLFYDGTIPGIRNASGYLKTRYGEQCLTLQLNKCAKGLGELFLKNADKCNWALYKGSVDYPYMIRAPYIVPGSL